MSLDKAVASGHEHRKPYYKADRFDMTCRPHGSCPYCRGSRLLYRGEIEEETALNELEFLAIEEESGATVILR